MSRCTIGTDSPGPMGRPFCDSHEIAMAQSGRVLATSSSPLPPPHQYAISIGEGGVSKGPTSTWNTDRLPVRLRFWRRWGRGRGQGDLVGCTHWQLVDASTEVISL